MSDTATQAAEAAQETEEDLLVLDDSVTAEMTPTFMHLVHTGQMTMDEAMDTLNDEAKLEAFLRGKGSEKPTGTPSTTDEKPANEDAKAKPEKIPAPGEEKQDDEPEYAIPEKYKGKGISDEILREMLTDEDGNPYENGKLYGKYDDPIKAIQGHREAQRVIETGRHKATETHEDQAGSAIAGFNVNSYLEEVRSVPPAKLNDEDKATVRDRALMFAVEDAAKAGLFDESGIDVPKTPDEARALKELDRELWLRILDGAPDRKGSRAHESSIMEFVTANKYLDGRADDINAEAEAAAFSAVKSDIERRIGDKIEDVEVFQEKYEHFCEQVNEMMMSDNPAVRERAEVLFDYHYNVPIINPQRFSLAFARSISDVIDKAIAASGGAKVKAEYEKRKAPPKWPAQPTTVAAETETVAQTGIGRMTLEQLTEGNAAWNIARKYFSGLPQAEAMAKAQAEIDRQIDLMAQEERQVRRSSQTRIY